MFAFFFNGTVFFKETRSEYIGQYIGCLNLFVYIPHFIRMVVCWASDYTLNKVLLMSRTNYLIDYRKSSLQGNLLSPFPLPPLLHPFVQPILFLATHMEFQGNELNGKNALEKTEYCGVFEENTSGCFCRNVIFAFSSRSSAHSFCKKTLRSNLLLSPCH